ncbi:hypothetical protein [Crassaminicella indica]|uniref:YqzL family protein n=1 Tax=Crassaminicella indica TaxID=2855394 RepID=A0ABX8RCR1_9CLOT|nr:hypothetical protein [Crassaminicella indica]QXM05705.1 hypothetical protein KVH43_10060 [Crassaminicella indica]
MLEKILWNLFFATGDINFYLDYKKVEKTTEVDQNEGVVFLDTYSLR